MGMYYILRSCEGLCLRPSHAGFTMDETILGVKAFEKVMAHVNCSVKHYRR